MSWAIGLARRSLKRFSEGIINHLKETLLDPCKRDEASRPELMVPDCVERHIRDRRNGVAVSVPTPSRPANVHGHDCLA